MSRLRDSPTWASCHSGWPARADSRLLEGSGVEIPATVTELPEGAFQLPNDARQACFIGAAPPAGHGPHRYFVVVHALDVESIGLPADATPAVLGFTMAGHILGRAVLTATAETPA